MSEAFINDSKNNNTVEFVVGQGGGILPQKVGMQGYIAYIGETSIVCENDKLQVKKELPYELFTSAEFGCGSGNLWLQCTFDGKPFTFCMRRKHWKSPAAKLLIQKIGEHTDIKDMKEYDGYTGKKFLLYMFK